MLFWTVIILALIGVICLMRVLGRVIFGGSARQPAWSPPAEGTYIATAETPDDANTPDIEYRTEGSGNMFRFRAICVGGALRFYIIRTMDYRAFGRSDDAHSTHRYHDNRGHFICWDGETPGTWGEVQGLLKAWSEGTERYCLYGTPF